ncbi:MULTISPECIES: DUF943 family protein [unclassified Pantoea]|uniref:DUF943 family protein n=1 Tax=unclassified Pantoea TaxID=2630326 RepID=UPI001232A275|nr:MULTISPECIES: DUF943 family protein [unclassified Pantoea]KAA6097949.1 DUF943 family protein [Pantoea sp. B_9]KAA6114066.1 DUF943 family protein [Pantoea sp. B_10]
MFKTAKATMVILTLGAVFFSKYFLIETFYHPVIKGFFSGNGALMVVVQHPPSSGKALENWWVNKIKPMIDQLPNQQQHDLKSIFVVNFNGGYKSLSFPEKDFSGESDEDYICFEEIKSEKRCLLKDYPVFINVGSVYYSLHMGELTINLKK